MAENYIDKIEVDGVERPIRDTSGSVRYDEAQSLSDAQKAQARGNINAAPGGFGWGGNAVSQPNKSLDDAKETGLYLCGPNYIGAPSGQEYIGYGTVLSIKRSDDSVIQVYWTDTTSLIAGTPLNLVRKFDGTKWYPWEWVNPPMELGVEYRTTERYLGKPVYVKVVDCGHFAAAGTVKEFVVPDGNVEHMVGCTGRVGEWQIPATLFAGSPADAGDVRLEGRVDDSHHFYIYLYSKAYDLTTWQTIVTIKYTKTTD